MAEGFKGTIDWAGYSVGEPPPLPPVGGFIGLLDFTGISVGIAGGAPETVLNVGFLVNIGRLGLR